MRLIQDVVKDILPTLPQREEAIIYLNRMLPNRKHTICDGAVGSWRMLQNGETVFYCPPILLP